MPFFNRFGFWILMISLWSCGVKSGLPFDEVSPPSPPDYSQSNAWAALPDKKDNADLVPKGFGVDQQADSKIDVFFLHPTTYTGKFKGEQPWNGDLKDEKLTNPKADSRSMVKFVEGRKKKLPNSL